MRQRWTNGARLKRYLASLGLEHKSHGSYAVVRFPLPLVDPPNRPRKRAPCLVLTISCSGFCNLTGIGDLEQAESCVDLACRSTELTWRSKPLFSIDSSTATGHWPPLEANFERILTRLGGRGGSAASGYNGCVVSYHNQKFPALHCRTGSGTLNLFRSGRFNILGAITGRELSYLCHVLRRVCS